jgi:glycine cleavage system H protein
MFSHDPYVTKALEYLLGVGFLVVFAFFWRYATGAAAVAVPATARARARTPIADMFRLPDTVMVHPGHAWAMAGSGDTVSVGMDDFAQQLVGRLKAVSLPPVGTALEQGGRAWRLHADGKSVEMLSPVSGQVVAVNDAVLRNPDAVNRDPFGEGWLIKVQTPRWETNRKQLLAGPAARRWTETSWEQLSALFAPELGTVMHDGGTPVNGFARGVDEEHWDAIARRFLLS